MTLSVGPKLDDLIPYTESGEAVHTTRGSHQGPATGMNVGDPVPGFLYYWVQHPRHHRGGSQYRRFTQWGFEAVPPDSPEHKLQETSASYVELGLDSYQAHGDVLLMRIPEERYKELSAFRRHQAEVARDGITNEYLDKAHEYEARYGSTADGPIYYRGSGHGTTSD